MKNPATFNKIIKSVGENLDLIGASPIESPDPFPNQILFELDGRKWCIVLLDATAIDEEMGRVQNT